MNFRTGGPEWEHSSRAHWIVSLPIPAVHQAGAGLWRKSPDWS